MIDPNKIENDIMHLNLLYQELLNDKDLVEELMTHFYSVDGVQSKDEASRCLIFFILGRLYEQKITKERTN